jgi:NAD(P)-dependent dehydrogenase (short-subunit alcohol dehydrogenase family)
MPDWIWGICGSCFADRNHCPLRTGMIRPCDVPVGARGVRPQALSPNSATVFAQGNFEMEDVRVMQGPDATPERDPVAMTQRFAGRVVIVTGGGGSIGRASARRLGREGARIAVVDLRKADADDTVSLLERDGTESAAFTCDVADPVAVADMVSAVDERFARIDCLYNAAGVLIPGTALTQRIEDWDLQYAVNVRGTLLVSRAVIPYMQRQGGGSIVHTASTAGLVGEPNCVAYDSTKHALVGLTRQMALDFARDGIRVNCVCPGWIDTGFNNPIFEQAGMDDDAVDALVRGTIALQRQGVADDVAPAVSFLLSDDARYITGHPLVVDGGFIAQ